MCMCKNPTVNGEQGYSWDGQQIGVRKPDPPELADGDTVMFDEPGRCGGIDSHCHHYTVVREKHGGRVIMVVRNGSGDKRIRLSNDKAIIEALNQLDSNGRYWMLNSVYHAASDASRNATNENNAMWHKAAAEKRIKTRKLRSQNRIKVWIETALTDTNN